MERLLVKSFSAPGGGSSHFPATKSKTDPIAALRRLILDFVNFTSYEEKQTFQAITYLLHEIITPEDESRCLEMIDELFQTCETERSHSIHNLIFFMSSWVSYGRISVDLLIDMKKLIRKRRNPDAYQELLVQIDGAISYNSPVIQRWAPLITPKQNMLAWMNKDWKAIDIGAALTEMCLPFYRLRTWEFKDEANFGPHLRLLNKRCTALTHFVATSILSAAIISEKRALQSTEKWLDIAKDLGSRNNFHMMFAIQNGLQINAVERIKWLFADLPHKSKKMKARLDALFNVVDKMKLLTNKTEQLAGKVCMVPCIYWLHNKAILSREAPLFLDKSSINIQRVISANNIFGNLIKMQGMRYDNIQAPEEILWYFMCLEIEDLNADDEKLREVSNSVLTKEARLGYIPLQEPISWDRIFVNARKPSEQPAKKKLSLPERLSSTKPSDEPMIPLTAKKIANSAPVKLRDDKGGF